MKIFVDENIPIITVQALARLVMMCWIFEEHRIRGCPMRMCGQEHKLTADY